VGGTVTVWPSHCLLLQVHTSHKAQEDPDWTGSDSDDFDSDGPDGGAGDSLETVSARQETAQPCNCRVVGWEVGMTSFAHSRLPGSIAG